MRKVFSTLALIATTALALMACSTESATNEVNNFQIHRGTNMSHWLSQSEERGEARKNHIQEDDFVRLNLLGFDFIRLPIDEVQFWDENGNKLPEAWDLLRFAVDQSIKNNLRVIVDLHIIRSLFQCCSRRQWRCQHPVLISESPARPYQHVVPAVRRAEGIQQ